MKNIKDKIIGFIFGVIITSSTVGVIAYTYQADDIEYTTNKNSNVHNVEQAINDLYEKTICSYELNEVVYEKSTSGADDFTPLCPGHYKLEVWGAQGGFGQYPRVSQYNLPGGYGGYSVGVIVYTTGKLYIAVGEQGYSCKTTNSYCAGTYNGGGGAGTDGNCGPSGAWLGTGGGATHIATSSGELSTFSSKQSDLLIVAGGGGGAYAHDYYGGHAGGYIGTYGKTTSQASPSYTCVGNSTFGIAGNGSSGYASAGGGGGYTGGEQYNRMSCGGTGYIGSTDLLTYGGVIKHMTCYACDESSSSNITTYTIKSELSSSAATSDTPKEGSGAVRITYLGR